MSAVLEAHSLSKTYPGRGSSGVVHALIDVTIDVQAGECVAIIGESGSGKSTFARLVLGLERPDGGTMTVLGAPPKPSGRATRSSACSIVLQDPADSLDPRMSVRAAISEPLVVSRPRPSRAKIAAAVEQAMSSVGLDPSMAQSRVSRLSGGQQQRVGIARALIRDPSLVVLDEPTSALDPSVQAQILGLLSSLQQSQNLSMLLITHDLAVAAHLATRMCVLRNGRVVEIGPAQVLWESPRHPYTRALLQASLMTGDSAVSTGPGELAEDSGLPHELDLDEPSTCPFVDVCARHQVTSCPAIESHALVQVGPSHWIAPNCESLPSN